MDLKKLEQELKELRAGFNKNIATLSSDLEWVSKRVDVLSLDYTALYEKISTLTQAAKQPGATKEKPTKKPTAKTTSKIETKPTKKAKK